MGKGRSRDPVKKPALGGSKIRFKFVSVKLYSLIRDIIIGMYLTALNLTNDLSELCVVQSMYMRQLINEPRDSEITTVSYVEGYGLQRPYDHCKILLSAPDFLPAVLSYVRGTLSIDVHPSITAQGFLGDLD